MTREEAIKKIKEAMPTLWKETKDAIQTIIPEFAESEDEKMRKWLITQLGTNYKGNYWAIRAIEWLEKQKECAIDSNNTSTDENEKIRKGLISYLEIIAGDYFGEFKKSDIIAYLEKQKEQKPVEYLSKRKVYDIMNKLTELSTSDLIPVESKEYVKIHEITSDVRSLLDYPIEQKPVEYVKFDNEFKNQVSHLFASVLNKEWEYDKGFVEYAAQQLLGYAKHEIKPSELSKEEIGHLYTFASYIKSKGYEDDGEFLEGVANKLKHLHPQPKQEWSEEDEEHLDSIIESYKELLKDYSANHGVDYIPYNTPAAARTVLNDIKFLKSLRPSWKPNEEQMYILNWVANILLNHDGIVEEEASKRLQSLYNDLKKLI